MAINYKQVHSDPMKHTLCMVLDHCRDVIYAKEENHTKTCFETWNFGWCGHHKKIKRTNKI